MGDMTKKVLLDICKEHQLYRTPSLNDKLYCNFKGFTKIANLEEYTGLKALFLEGNALDSLEGMPPLKELRCLYVQQNCLSHISHLEELEQLDTLNLSCNPITKLENLSCCKNLKTLICTAARLDSVDSIAHLAECTGLQTLDLQNNKLADPAIVDIIKAMPNLRCLYLKGNEAVSRMKNYRKSLIAAIPSLTYLDDRPIFEVERRCCEAWARGGMEAEREERIKCKEEEKERDRKNFEYLQAIRREGWRKRRQELGLPEGDGDPALEGMSDSEWEPPEDPPELVAARKKLAAYAARPGEEEPPELTEARRELTQGGGIVQESNWDSLLAENQAKDYFAVKQRIQEDREFVAAVMPEPPVQPEPAEAPALVPAMPPAPAAAPVPAFISDDTIAALEEESPDDVGAASPARAASPRATKIAIANDDGDADAPASRPSTAAVRAAGELEAELVRLQASFEADLADDTAAGPDRGEGLAGVEVATTQEFDNTQGKGKTPWDMALDDLD